MSRRKVNGKVIIKVNIVESVAMETHFSFIAGN